MNAEDLLLDKTFLAWYYKTDEHATAMWERRIQASPQVRQVVEEAVMLILLKNIPAESEPSDQKLIDERTKLLRTIEALESKDKLHLLRRKKFPWVAAASILLLMGLYGVFAWWTQSSLVYVTQGNEIKEVMLPDSSIVALNQHSSLRLTKQWSEQDTLREVWLEGEAYFTVRKTPHKSKFIVHSGEVKVEVLGTTFNVKNSDSLTTVVLTTGKVQLSKENASEVVVMQPGELAEYSTISGKVTHKQVNTELFTSWKEGKIMFENASIHEIATYLANHYGLKVNYEALRDSQNEFNGTFPMEDVSFVLEALSKAYHWDIQLVGDSLILKP